MKKKNIRDIALIAVIYFITNLVAQHLRGENVDIARALYGVLVFTVFISVGILYTSKRKRKSKSKKKNN